MRKLWLILTLSLGLLGTISAQASNDPAYYRKLKSPFLEVDDDPTGSQGAYPWWAKVIQSDLLKFDPSGSSSPVSKGCDPDKLLLTPQGSLSELKEYFKLCNKDLETIWHDIVSNTYMTVFLKMQPTKHPFAQHVILNLPGGVKVKGLLGLKGDGVKRPLVLMRLGIFSNTSEFFPERSLFMQLFEQSPFNILLLESLSGSEYIEHNETFTLGGFEEGLQNFWIARQLKNPKEPLANLVESIHMVGMSLGGHGTFFAALLNEHNEKPISSFLAFCPLVNFAETFNYHQMQNFTLKIMNFWAYSRLPKLQQIYPNLSKDRYVADVLEALKNQKSTWYPEYNELRWPRNMTNESFMERLLFWPDFKGIKTPFLIFASKKDPIVPYDLNSSLLLQKEIDVGDSQLEVIPLDNGYHCSLPAAYNWKAMTTIFQKFIKTHSNWTPHIEKYVLDYEIPVGTKIDWEVNEKGAFITFGSWSDYHRHEFPIDLINAYKFTRPLSNEDQSLLRRWLYQNVKFSQFIPPKGQDTLTRTELVWDY